MPAEMSAEMAIVLVAVSVSFPDDGSVPAPDTVPVTLTEPVLVGATASTTLTGLEPLTAIAVDRVQVAVVVPEHDHPVPDADTRVVPTGTGTVTVVVPLVC